MIAKSVFLSILILQTVGCATTGKECTPPVPPSDKVSELIVYRPSIRYSSNYDAPISIDDCIVGWLEDGAFIRYKIAAGTHKVRAEKRFLAAGGDAEISTAFALGETVYVRYALLPAGLLLIEGGKAGFAVTDKISAEKELPALRDLAPAKN